MLQFGGGCKAIKEARRIARGKMLGPGERPEKDGLLEEKLKYIDSRPSSRDDQIHQRTNTEDHLRPMHGDPYLWRYSIEVYALHHGEAQPLREPK